MEVIEHLFPMLKILDSEEDGHGDGEETDQAKDDLESETLVKFDLSHRRYPTSSNAPLEGGLFATRKKISDTPHRWF